MEVTPTRSEVFSKHMKQGEPGASSSIMTIKLQYNCQHFFALSPTCMSSLGLGTHLSHFSNTSAQQSGDTLQQLRIYFQIHQLIQVAQTSKFAFLNKFCYFLSRKMKYLSYKIGFIMLIQQMRDWYFERLSFFFKFLFPYKIQSS